jgi:hypothetical protein
MRPGISSTIPKKKKKYRAWNGARQALKDTKNSISKAKYQSDVYHILRQMGNRSQGICSIRSHGEKGICGNIASFGLKNS